MYLYGIKENKDSIFKKIGDISQLGGSKYYKFIDGLRKGVRAIDVNTPAGIDMTILPDRGMDISNLFYKSIPICWRSPTKEASPLFFESRGQEWLRTFFGGLITTCGLTYDGPPCIDKDEKLGLHGRISNLSAEEVCYYGKWIKDNYIITVKGKVREVKVNGEKLELTRKIKTYFDTPKILVEDSVENIGHKESPIMIRYHINIGYPIISSNSKLIESKAKIIPKNKEAKKNLMEYSNFTEPINNSSEQLFIHDIKSDINGDSIIAIINENFNNGEGIGISVKFNKKNLPYLIQWKKMGMGEYICGIEPSNSFSRGRNIERKETTLEFIGPNEIKNYKLEFNILCSNREIKKIKEYCRQI